MPASFQSIAHYVAFNLVSIEIKSTETPLKDGSIRRVNNAFRHAVDDTDSSKIKHVNNSLTTLHEWTLKSLTRRAETIFLTGGGVSKS